MKKFIVVTVLDEGFIVEENNKTKAKPDLEQILFDIECEIKSELIPKLSSSNDFSIEIKINYNLPKPSKE